MHILGAGVLVGVALLAACNVEVTSSPPQPPIKLIIEGRGYDDPKKHAAFVAALKDANIPFVAKKRENGTDYVEWDAGHSEQVNKIEAHLFGVPPSPGRHASLQGKERTQFLAWLQQEGIPHQIAPYHGEEYISWTAADHEKVKRHPLISRLPYIE